MKPSEIATSSPCHAALKTSIDLSILLERGIWLATTTCSLALIWIWRFVPLQDYADWVYQGELFTHWLRGALPASYRWKGLPAPNAGSTIIIGLLALVMPAAYAGKLFLSGYVLTFAAAGSQLLRRRACALLPALLVWNYAFVHGNINYAFSVPMFMLAVLELRTSRVSQRHLIAWSLVLYFCHGTTWVAWMVVVLHVVGRRAWMALMPSVALGVVYVVGRAGDDLLTPTNGLVTLLELKWATLLRFLSLFPCFYPLQDRLMRWERTLVTANWCFALGMMFLFGWSVWRGYNRRSRWTVSALALMFLFLVAPSEIGGLVNPGERFLLPAFLVALFELPRTPVRSLSLGIAWLSVFQLLFLFVHGGSAEHALVRLQAALDQHVRDCDVAIVAASHFKRDQARVPRPFEIGWRSLPRHHPLLHHSLFWKRPRDCEPPIFETGTFAFRGPHRTIYAWAELNAQAHQLLIVIGDSDSLTSVAEYVHALYVTRARGEGFALLARLPPPDHR